MKFQSLNEWAKLNEGGAAISSSRRLSRDDLQTTYEWVLKNVVPKLGISEDDIDVIGSFGKKREGEDYGDLDLAISRNAIMERNGLGEDQVLDFINDTLASMGFETKVMKGFKQVTAGIPIPGDAEDGIAQVDFMTSPDLDWSRFVYASPDFTREESKYKGVYRNLLLMAIITETAKDIIKKTPEGDIEELETNVIRYPEGIWRARKSFMGKRGLVKTGKLLRDFDKFVTTNPQEVVELAVGKGYTPESINTFEKLWFLATRDDFIHWAHEEDIMRKFAQNLKSMGLPYPQEAVETYPEIFSDGIVKESIKTSDVLEDMADQEHDSWSRWMEHLFKKSEKNSDGTVTIPKDKVERWERQMKTPYHKLSDKEKESDRKEVRKFIKIVKKAEEK